MYDTDLIMFLLLLPLLLFVAATRFGAADAVQQRMGLHGVHYGGRGRRRRAVCAPCRPRSSRLNAFIMKLSDSSTRKFNLKLKNKSAALFAGC